MITFRFSDELYIDWGPVISYPVPETGRDISLERLRARDGGCMNAIRQQISVSVSGPKLRLHMCGLYVDTKGGLIRGCCRPAVN